MATTDTGAPPPCPSCQVVYAGVQSPISLALDTTDVYFTQGTTAGAGKGSIWSVPRAGGTNTIIYGGDTAPEIVKVLPGSTPAVTWSSLETGAGAGLVWLQSVGPPTALGMGLTSPFGVAIDSVSGYWVSVAGGGAQVQSATLSGGTPTTLGTATGGFIPMGVAVSTSTIYFVAELSGGGGGLFSLPIAGATPTEIWTGDATSAPVDVAVDATNVYWTDQGDGAVYAMPVAGGPVTTLASRATSAVSGPARIAIDSTRVYFSDPAGVGLYEVPTGGGTLKTLVAPSAGVTGLVGVAADDNDSYVYFSSSTDIVRIAK
jgi:hypothetical protein